LECGVRKVIAESWSRRSNRHISTSSRAFFFGITERFSYLSALNIIAHQVISLVSVCLVVAFDKRMKFMMSFDELSLCPGFFCQEVNKVLLIFVDIQGTSPALEQSGETKQGFRSLFSLLLDLKFFISF
jgi:hypothetical protein